ncbi:MAG: M66 family metalloprotease, partial [Cellvibrionaceae bacterium]|nr:M66 family metalloprotease [Cellvibrionaceae bacterium]
MVQNVIMPTKNKLPGDVQQRPISLRKTMVLFKPQLEFGVGEDINLTAKDKRGRTVYTATMRPPEQLTRPAGQFTIDLPQADYDLVIDDAAAMKKLETDPNGSHMASLLARYDSINIHTMDSIWSPNFYLPKGQFNGKTITLSDHATFNSKVFFNDTSITSERGDKNSWTHIDGRWRLNASLADPLAPQTEFSLVIEDPESMQTFGNDPEGEHFAKLLDRHDHINIRTHNGIWTRNFYLPKGAQYHNKTVSFHHFAGFSSDIHYNNTTTNISIGDKVTWVNINGVWASVLDREFNRIRYSDNTFSAILPAAIMRPGLSLHFSSGNLNGHISQLNIGAPNELIIHTIDIGMLAPPRNKFTFQNAPELHRQYLQTMPARKLTVSHYQTLQLDQVMLPDGRLLTDYDPSKGGAFEGEMRNKIGKLLISHGIDNANYGLNSSGGLHEIWHPFASPQYTAHNSQGNYINGLQIHGLSGGNGMVTLAESTGNEFSHELGHNYGMGHFPGGFVGSINAPADKVNSTWGWDSDHDFFVPNFEKRISNLDMCYAGQCSAPFMGRRFNAGAMSGGWP